MTNWNLTHDKGCLLNLAYFTTFKRVLQKIETSWHSAWSRNVKSDEKLQNHVPDRPTELHAWFTATCRSWTVKKKRNEIPPTSSSSAHRELSKNVVFTPGYKINAEEELHKIYTGLTVQYCMEISRLTLKSFLKTNYPQVFQTGLKSGDQLKWDCGWVFF